MRFELKMPDLATTDSEIRIVRWMIEPGQKVERGQALLEVETDKATSEVESVVRGVLAEVRAQVGDAVSVGQVIAVFEVDEARTAATPATSAPCVASGPAIASPAAKPVAQGARAPGGMFARNRAAAAQQAKPASGIPLTPAHRTAARRLQESKQTVPHFYLQTSVNASAMVARRKAAASAQPAWDAFFVQAVAKALARFERFRCRFDTERLKPAETEAIGVAVDHDGELYVLPIDSPSGKTVEQISDELRQGVEKLRGGDEEVRRLRPALITITNLGVCNVESFIPIINPPEAAILGVGRVMPTVVAREDGTIAVERRCMITLSVDHRVASGKYAGDFLGAIVKELESV